MQNFVAVPLEYRNCTTLVWLRYNARFVVANTIETLLLGDLETLKLSEIPWQAPAGGGGGNGLAGDEAAAEKFIFDSPSAALVYYASELSIVEYGKNEVLRSGKLYTGRGRD